MKLTLEGIQNKEQWEALGVELPSYDVKHFSYLYRRNRGYPAE